MRKNRMGKNRAVKGIQILIVGGEEAWRLEPGTHSHIDMNRLC